MAGTVLLGYSAPRNEPCILASHQMGRASLHREGFGFESLLCVEISFGIARVIPCDASRPNRSMDSSRQFDVAV